jgi:malto-oligosyltrehalose trehalohydrolase
VVGILRNYRGDILVEYAFGPLVSEDAVEFRLWAPLAENVSLKIEGSEPRPMQRTGDGWHRCSVGGIGPGCRYKFMLPDGLEVPDPGSRYQPQDVHGVSEVVDFGNYTWKAEAWAGRPWEESVIYELHVGTFTSEGTFLGAMEHLDHLVDLGITAIQIMPVSDFPGRFNWGYDGVLPYAPDSSYGRPEDFMALVDAAHEHGISVFLDVVYNHFGPDGNYLPAYAPLFTEHHKTPWGNGVNYDGTARRRFASLSSRTRYTGSRNSGWTVCASTRCTPSRTTARNIFFTSWRAAFRQAAGTRHVHLIVENEDNDCDLLRRDGNGRTTRFTAQWNDDVHHVLHIAATGETFGYYRDYVDDEGKVGRALAEGLYTRANTCPTVERTAANPQAIYRKPPLSPSFKTMIRSAIGRAATAWLPTGQWNPLRQ